MSGQKDTSDHFPGKGPEDTSSAETRGAPVSIATTSMVNCLETRADVRQGSYKTRLTDSNGMGELMC